MVALTDSAVGAIRRVMETSDEPAEGLRIMVSMGGCSGMQYFMGLECEAMDGDAIFEFGAVKVYVDEDSQPLLCGACVDFVDGDEGPGFVFNNPNARDVCTCGKSFGASPTALAAE